MSILCRYVAMCDILGFREFIRTRSLQEAVNQFENLRRQAILNATERRVHSFDQNGYTLQIDNISYVLFSDTVLLWVDADEGNEDVNIIQNFFDGVAALIAYSAQSDLPFRVGVSYGECYIDQTTNIYIGQTIIDAYLTEQNQQWFGGACHPSCERAPFFENVIRRHGLVLPYEVPIKEEELQLNYAIEWVSWAEVDFEENLRRLIDNNSRPDVKLKYKNALNFYRVVRPPEVLLTNQTRL